MVVPAGEKLRTVLDYVPCEACLATTVDDQELLCSICRRLDRQVGVRIAVKTTVILERPTDPALATPVVIPPPQLQSPSLPSVSIRYREPGAKEPRGHAPTASIEVVLEPFETPRPVVAAAPQPEPEPQPEEEHGHLWDDVAEFTGFPSDLVSMTPAAENYERYVEPEPTLAPALVEQEPVDFPQDDYVFRPPAEEEPVYAAPTQSVAEEEWLPQEEVPVQTTSDEPSPWAPPREEPFPPPVEEEILETTPVVEDEIVETTVVEEPFLPSRAAEAWSPPPPVVDEDGEVLETIVDDDAIETTLVDAPTPTGEPAPESPRSGSDLWRLRGFDANAEHALNVIGIESISHLSGHDANELAQKTGVSATRLDAWIDVADLQEEVGVPIDAANAIVAAGFQGPRGLREHEVDDIVARVHANGGHVHAQDVRRWKRRA